MSTLATGQAPTEAAADQSALAQALWTSAGLFVTVLIVAAFGLVAGYLIGIMLPGFDRNDPKEFAWTWFGYPMRSFVSRGWIANVLNFSYGGLFVKAVVEFFNLVPALVNPIKQKFELKQGDSFEPVTFRSLCNLAYKEWRGFVALWLAATSLAITAFAWSPDKKDPPYRSPEPLRNEVLVGLASDGLLEADAAGQRFVLGLRRSTSSFLVFFAEEDPNVDSEHFVKGLKWSEATQENLELYARQLAYCNRDGKVATVTITGFASSSGRADTNWKLANARATRVRTFLQEEVPDIPVQDAHDGASLGRTNVIANRWESFRAMALARGYVDTVGKTYYEERGQLNRRAELVLTDSGACGPSALPR